MDSRGKSMAQKRARHYPETKTVVAIAMILFGIVASFCLVIIWPQQFIVTIFNSRLSRRLIVDNQDYYTCSRDYSNFVISEPDSTYNMITFYVFAVTNAAQVIQRGFEPKIVETGPYGFVKNSYKYDIYFEPDTSLTVTYKEYSYLTEITDDPDACEAMYYRMSRDYLTDNACEDNSCKCKSSLAVLTVVNPLFLKILWQETPFQLLAHYSVQPFAEIKQILDEPFTEAVKATLVTNAFKEVYLFRLYMQSRILMNASISNLIVKRGMTLDQIANTGYFFQSCGLNVYGVSNYCPFSSLSSALTQYKGMNVSVTTYPSLTPFFIPSYSFSVLNITGLAQWIAISWYYSFIDFNSLSGFTTVSKLDVEVMLAQLTQQYGEVVYGTNDKFKPLEIAALTIVMKAMAKFVGTFVLGNTQMYTAMNLLAYREFQTSYDPVVCAPNLLTCIWQYGYMTKYEHATMTLSDTLTSTIIDISTELSTNPNNIYKDLNAAPYYNAYLYCNNVFHHNESIKLECTDLSYTYDDGITNKPAGFWGADFGISSVNFTSLKQQWKKQSDSIKYNYFLLSCNISNLIQRVYRESTSFHDEYVIKYVNKYQDSNLNYNFTTENWSDLGIAQWAGGFITQSIMNVRTITQVKRNGMWRIGNRKYYDYLMEYASWAVVQGYANAWIYSLDDARLLLETLARYDEVGVAFRSHIMYRGSTLIGNGSHVINGVGESGEVTFMTEVNFADFSCDGEASAACHILNQFFSSSADECAYIAQLYRLCTRENLFNDNLWVNSTACSTFETTSTAPTTGIQCNAQFIYGQPHPYRKSRGNIIYQMLYVITLYTSMQAGLWCNAVPNCDFGFGGMFTTTTVRRILFEGYTEPSVIKYYDLKYYMKHGISFECVNNSYDVCGVKNYVCDDEGVKILFPLYDHTSQTFLQTRRYEYVLNYGVTPKDEYYAPDIIYNQYTNQLLWPYAYNQSLASDSMQEILDYDHQNFTLRTSPPYTSSSSNRSMIIKFLNPFWQAFAAWNTNDTAFLKYYQCLNRFFNGRPGVLSSCENTVYTGRDVVNKSLTLVQYHGNSTIYFYDHHHNASIDDSVVVKINSSLIKNQYPMYLWDGFLSYPYTYSGKTAGTEFTTLAEAFMFSDVTLMHLTLTQRDFTYIFEKQFSVSLPLATGPIAGDRPVVFAVNVRRFVEDAYSWQPYRTMGNSSDSYGIHYDIPIGMAPLQRFADFPIFAETPNSYGNLLWGGIEYTFVSGTSQNRYSQRTFIDYDPVTGKAIRSANRKQITLRVEASSLFPAAFSSQQRCIVPTKTYALSSGYGCFAYIPLFWYEEALIMNNQSMYQIYDHYYTRPQRANNLILAGIVLGVLFATMGIFLYINEAYYRRKFHARVYVD